MRESPLKKTTTTGSMKESKNSIIIEKKLPGHPMPILGESLLSQKREGTSISTLPGRRERGGGEYSRSLRLIGGERSFPSRRG